MTWRAYNRSLKSRAGWGVLLLALAAFLAVGVVRGDTALTPQDRVDSISKRIACPVCSGESVFESQAPSAKNIRAQVASDVDTGLLSDDEIIAEIQRSFGGRVLLVPKATGLDALVWVLPVVALVLAVGGLAVTFRRWRGAAGALPSDDDRRIVAAALATRDEP